MSDHLWFAIFNIIIYSARLPEEGSTCGLQVGGIPFFLLVGFLWGSSTSIQPVQKQVTPKQARDNNTSSARRSADEKQNCFLYDCWLSTIIIQTYVLKTSATGHFQIILAPSWAFKTIFFLTGLRIYTGEYKA